MFIVTVICVRSYEKRNPYLLFEIWASAAFVQRKSPVIVMKTLDKTTSLGAFSSKACTSGVRPINCNDFIFPVTQTTNKLYREIEQRTHWAFWNSESVNHCVAKWFAVSNRSNWIAFRESFESERDFRARFASHLNQNRTSELVSRVIWFRTGLQSSFRESFESERDFKARFASHLIQNGTSKLVSRVIWFRTGLQSSFRESFESEQDFKARFASHLNQNRTSKLVSRVIWIRTGLQSSFRESFESEQDFKARFASHLIQNRTSKLVSRVIWIRTGLQSSFRESPPEIKKIIQQRHDYIR